MRKLAYITPLAFFFLAWLIVPDELFLMFKIIVFTGMFLVFIFAIAVVAVIWQRFQIERANRRKKDAEANKAQRESELQIVVAGNQVFISDMNHNAWWRSCHLDHRFYGNSQDTYEPLNEQEQIENWRQWHAPKTIEKTFQLPAQIQTSELDLMTIFTQLTQSYAIIANQQVGKTFQAQQIANYWLQHNIQPIVIGPKWDIGEWSGCKLYGGGHDFDKVQAGLDYISQIAKGRHADKNKSHKLHPVLPVFFDDWTAIRKNLEGAESFILDATTLYASVNIVLYFILHLDTANAWGVGKVGAALKNGFLKLLIEPGYDENGLIDRTRNTGYLLRPGQSIKDKQPIKLFSQSALIIEPCMNNRDEKIVAMIQAGASNSEIAQEIYHQPNLSGDNFYKVRGLREKWG